jgi:hypothetical protein
MAGKTTREQAQREFGSIGDHERPRSSSQDNKKRSSERGGDGFREAKGTRRHHSAVPDVDQRGHDRDLN